MPRGCCSIRAAPSAAAISGALAAIAVELAKWGYAIYTKKALFYNEVYGGLAILPLFLIWVYVNWNIFLGGALLASVLPACVNVAPSWAPLLFLAASVENSAMIIIAIAMMFFVFGQIPINDAMVAKYTDDRWRARAYALRYVLSFGGSATAVPLVAVLHGGTGGFEAVFLTLSVIALAVAGAALAFPRPPQSVPAASRSRSSMLQSKAGIRQPSVTAESTQRPVITTSAPSTASSSACPPPRPLRCAPTTPPPSSSATLRAPASSAFSTSSFTTEAGRSTTSPAAIWLARCAGRR